MRYFILLLIFSFGLAAAQAQDTTIAPVAKGDTTAAPTQPDTTKKIVPHSPRKAMIRSAILPGWGQAYNKKYWKIPIVYGALGTAAGFFIYNRREYIDSRDAYRNMMDEDDTNNHLIKPKFRPVDPEAVRQYRIAVRQYVDYSVLAFLVLWGLNVVDAAVDGHMRDFNVTDDLSLQIKPGFSPTANTAGLSIVLNIGKKPTPHFFATR